MIFQFMSLLKPPFQGDFPIFSHDLWFSPSNLHLVRGFPSLPRWKIATRQGGGNWSSWLRRAVFVPKWWRRCAQKGYSAKTWTEMFMGKGNYPKMAMMHNNLQCIVNVPVFTPKRDQMQVDISAPRSNSGLSYWAIPSKDGEITTIYQQKKRIQQHLSGIHKSMCIGRSGLGSLDR